MKNVIIEEKLFLLFQNKRGFLNVSRFLQESFLPSRLIVYLAHDPECVGEKLKRRWRTRVWVKVIQDWLGWCRNWRKFKMKKYLLIRLKTAMALTSILSKSKSLELKAKILIGPFRLIKENKELISRAFSSQFIIPDFKSFCSSLKQENCSPASSWVHKLALVFAGMLYNFKANIKVLWRM